MDYSGIEDFLKDTILGIIILGGLGSIAGVVLLMLIRWVFGSYFVPLLIKACGPLMKAIYTDRIAARWVSKNEPEMRYLHFGEKILSILFSTILFVSISLAFFIYILSEGFVITTSFFILLSLVFLFFYTLILDFAAYLGVRQIYFSSGFEDLKSSLMKKDVDHLIDLDDEINKSSTD